MILKWRVVSVLFFAGMFSCQAVLTLSGTYSQNFDALPSAEATGNSWTDNSTIAGWYGSETKFDVNHGNSTTSALYDFGASGSSDRALGSVAGNTHTYCYGIAFQNGIGGTITSLQVSYRGEEWRRGENLNTLLFEYYIGDPTSIKSTENGWTEVAGLGFTSPQSGSNTSIDGNANSSTIAYTITGLNIASGTDFWVRWKDVDDTGSDAGLAIDDLSITAVPELPEWGLISALGLMGVCGIRTWREQRAAGGKS